MRSRRIPADAIALHAARAVAVVLLIAVYAFFVGTPEGRRIDVVLSDRDVPARLTGAWLIAAALVSSTPALGLAVVGLVWHARRIGCRDDGTRAFVIVATAALGARVLKALLQDLDPVGREAARELGSAFYPSGHAAAATALCLATTVVLRHHPWPYLLLAGGAWCGVLGFSIFATGSHHISDVIGGYLLGFAVAVALALRGWPASGSDGRAGQTTVIVMLTSVIAAVIAAELAGRMAVSSLPARAVLLTAAAGLCAIAFSLVSLFLRLLDPARAMETAADVSPESAPG